MSDRITGYTLKLLWKFYLTCPSDTEEGYARVRPEIQQLYLILIPIFNQFMRQVAIQASPKTQSGPALTFYFTDHAPSWMVFATQGLLHDQIIPCDPETLRRIQHRAIIAGIVGRRLYFHIGHMPTY